MAKDPELTKATVHSFDKPEKLSALLQQDREDCVSCRLMGSATFFGLGAFSYFSGRRNLALQRERILKSNSRFGMRSRHAGIAAVSLVFAGMGYWRLIN